MLQVYSVTDYKKCQNVVGISDTLTMPSVPLKFYRTFFHYLWSITEQKYCNMENIC